MGKISRSSLYFQGFWTAKWVESHSFLKTWNPAVGSRFPLPMLTWFLLILIEFVMKLANVWCSHSKEIRGFFCTNHWRKRQDTAPCLYHIQLNFWNRFRIFAIIEDGGVMIIYEKNMYMYMYMYIIYISYLPLYSLPTLTKRLLKDLWFAMRFPQLPKQQAEWQELQQDGLHLFEAARLTRRACGMVLRSS